MRAFNAGDPFDSRKLIDVVLPGKINAGKVFD